MPREGAMTHVSTWWCCFAVNATHNREVFHYTLSQTDQQRCLWKTPTRC